MSHVADVRDLLTMLESIEDVWYHGSTHDIDGFVLDFVGTGNDQYGPGIYFTRNKELASRYGDKIYICNIDTSNTLSSSTKIDKKVIKSLIMNTPDEYAYTNWGEDKDSADIIGIRHVVSTYDNMYDALMEVWATWYHDYTKDFVNAIGAIYNCGIAMDGAEPYLMVYNTSSIHVQEVLHLE